MAACRALGFAPADAQRFAKVEGPFDALIGEILAPGWPVNEVLRELTSLTVDIGNNRELVERVSTRLQLPPGDAASKVRIAGAVSDIETNIERSLPNVADELTARVRPIREQWEARGPGLLAEIARLADPLAVPASAEIVLVLPYVGGHGVAYPAQNRIVLEAMLVHPLPELRETLRIAWLLSQLNADLPALADVLAPKSRDNILALATLPAVLSAAEAVELGHCDERSLAGALSAWRLERDDPELAGKLWSWWNAWLDQRAKWPVAVAALNHLVG